MADQLIIFDTTLRDGEQSPGASMTRDEKLRIARQLERLKVDVIEAPGDCSPSRKVVSKMNRRSVTAIPSQKTKRPAAFASGPVRRDVGTRSFSEP